MVGAGWHETPPPMGRVSCLRTWVRDGTKPLPTHGKRFRATSHPGATRHETPPKHNRLDLVTPCVVEEWGKSPSSPPVVMYLVAEWTGKAR